MYKNLAAAVLAAASCLLPLHAQSPAARPASSPASAPLKVGFVYVAPITDAGWVRQHEEGRKAVQSALGEPLRAEPALVELKLVPDQASNDEALSEGPSAGTVVEGSVVPFPRRPGSAGPA